MNWVRARTGLARALTGVTTACCLLLAGQPSAVAEEVPTPPVPSGLQRGIDDALPPPALPAAPAPPIGDLPPQLAALWHAVQSPPTGDQIFDTWPAGLDAMAAGAVIEQRDITAIAAPRIDAPIGRAVLLKFRSTSAAGAPSFGTATLVVPAAAWAGPGDRPVLVDNKPINSLGLRCTPGYAMAHGEDGTSSSAIDALTPTTASAVSRGYAVLIPDHEGPFMAYAEPNVAAHVILDSIRAVRSLPASEFGAGRFALTGYSGGAIASYAAAMLLDDYAPELAEVVVGASMGGLVTDNRVVAHSFDGKFASGVLLAVVLAYAREHPEILANMNHLAQWVATSPINNVCGEALGPLGVVGIPLEIAANIPHPLDSAVADDIFARTDLSDRTSAVPLYIYHAAHDLWIPLEGAQQLYRTQCDRGVPAVFRSEPGEHVTGLTTGFPGAFDWLDARLRGEPAPNECT
ncbi:lipase family protein [Nocardia zapadnayensis]|uniref:lipase family protein n=1 Tax=Nocardia rhamnosiphila TaxID=426716 RepID=UPI0022481D3D|nr:lipase family protein [Nocardia zapadnayensis]MCX0273146.1 lipase family protein [Nocardia zapadnayensis]